MPQTGGSGTLTAMLWTRGGGSPDGPLLVLLHGLGGTAEVWLGLEALLPDRWDGGWLAVDLLGHGRSPRATAYGFGDHAAAVAGVLPEDRDLVLMGHSMGGMVALALAPRMPRVRQVLGFSIKGWWPAEHVAGMEAQADRPPRVSATQQEAVGRFLRGAGLTDLVPAGAPENLAGVVAVDGGWTLAQDPGTYRFGVPDLPALLAAATCPVTLARGSEDPFVRAADLGGATTSVTWDGLGHNPHVEDPSVVAGLLRH